MLFLGELACRRWGTERPHLISCARYELAGDPTFDFISAVLLLPLFQLAVIAAFGLDNFARVRVLVLLDLSGTGAD